MVKISIIVPIYNVSKYLDQCLQSLVTQTLKEIEIICVDDCSTDHCRQIIETYGKMDGRIKPVFLEKNSGIVAARKHGVELAQGRYVLFCDGDDSYMPGACQILYDEMSQNPVDILQFGTNVVYCKDYPERTKKILEATLKPYLKPLTGNILEACYHDHKFGHTLWNKLYGCEFVKHAYSLLSDEHITISEDLYAFFVLSYLAKSFRGIRDKLYIYNFYTLPHRDHHMNIRQFERQCQKLKIIGLLYDFLQSQEADPRYYGYYHTIKNNMIEDVVYQWYYSLTISESRRGYDLLMEELGAFRFLSELARRNWADEREILQRISVRDSDPAKKRPVKRIGVYYHRMRNGGVEKVLSQLLVVWQSLGYEPILITDEEPSQDDFEIQAQIERVVIASPEQSCAKQYRHRAKSWKTVIKKYNLDTIIYNSSTCHVIMWDTCLIKGLGCNLMVYTHSMFAGSMFYSPLFASYLPLVYRMVDCVVCLSRTDLNFWNHYCRAYLIQNPIEPVPRHEMSPLNTKNILWVGRLAEEKQPELVLEAFELVLLDVPDATLTIVGEGESSSFKQALITKVKELKIRDHVTFTGFTTEVGSYYQNASVLAFTSMCEAAPVVLSESKSYGVPIVMFDLPNVEFTRDLRGVIKVPQDDVSAMASNLIMLLENHSKRMEMGKEGRESMETFARFDLKATWKSLFENFHNTENRSADEEGSVMLDLLLGNLWHGVTNMISSYQDGRSSTTRLNMHEEILNRHEEVVTRHETSINHQWEVQKWHEERLAALEKRRRIKNSPIYSAARSLYRNLTGR